MPTVASLHAGGNGVRKDPARSLTLVAGFGAEGDRHAGRDPDRALLITTTSAYRHLAERGLDLPHGSLTENVVLDGLDSEGLAPGTRLRVGSVVLEAASPCTVCVSLSVVDPRLPKLVHGRRGVYARVLRDGIVRVGDEVDVLEPDGPGSP